MPLSRKSKPSQKFVPVDTLIVIGNGFDIWSGLDTSYEAFRKYYVGHLDEILRRLHIKKHHYIDEDGHDTAVSDVEIIYGDPFDPGELESDFWGAFETSLADIDAERLNLFFDKDRKGLRRMNRSIRNAKRILRTAFCDWIGTITIDSRDQGYRFGDNCLVINFNYTDTASKHGFIRPEQEYHIHGEATDKESIVFGHSTHPQLPQSVLYKLGGRFRGLYFVDKLLYETDKHTEDNIQLLCMFLALHGVMCEEIRHVYVLGHSMSPPDIEYFAFLMRSTQMNDGQAVADEDIPEVDEPEEPEAFYRRLQYTVNHVGYHMDEDSLDPEDRMAMQRAYEEEQAYRSSILQKDFLKMLTRGANKKKLQKELAEYTPPTRQENAQWHITYHGDKAEIWAKKVMEALNCDRFQLYSSIDECIAGFKQTANEKSV